jgi:thiol-disulfide isomerase/thioredoxin
MNKNTGIFIGIIVLVAVAGGIYSSSRQGKEVMVKEETKNEITPVQPGQLMENKPKAGEDSMVKAGSYETYAPEKLSKAINGDVVLFFRASWCPTCIGVDKDIRANLSSIPANLTILDVNYDNSNELKKKYGVTYQHTFVRVDKDGNMIKKWSGSPTLADIVVELK